MALSLIQEGLIQARVGRWRNALECIDAVPDDAELEPPQRCALEINRGLAHLGLAEIDEATAALESALAIAAGNGLADQEFKVRHNLACLAFVDNDLPRALTLMHEADRMDTAVSRDRAGLDRAEVLLAAGLVDGARDALADALADAHQQGHRIEEGEISLRLARVDLLVADHESARSHVRSALSAYRTRQAAGLVDEAEIIAAALDVAEERDLPAVVARLSRRNAGLTRVPVARDRTAVRLEAEARLLLGDVDGAGRRMTVLDQGGRTRESLEDGMQDALVRSRLALARQDPAESRRQVEVGNRLLAVTQLSTCSLGVRAGLARHGRQLSRFDIERAVAGGDPADVLETADRWRAVSHRVNPSPARSDPELAELTRELRRLRQLPTEGREAAHAIAEEVGDLESRIAQREWALATRAAEEEPVHPVDVEEALAAARDRDASVVEFVESGGSLLIVALGREGPRLVELGPAEGVAALVTRLRRDLRARAGTSAASPMRPTLDRATAASLRAVDDALRPALAGSGRLVLVPSRTLAGLPWGLLPALHGRPLTVAPSLTRWVRGPARPADPAPDRLRALYGPGLLRSAPEVRAVREAWATPRTRTGSVAPEPSGGHPDRLATTSERPAASEEVVEALGRARVVHLAAHGTHEAQSPLFSSVRMADGPLYAHEFPHPVRAEHVALASCDVGQFSSRPGDEPLGLAIALVALGARSVLAAVAPVADDAASPPMVAHHRRLASGQDAAESWCETVQDHPEMGAFCLYGSDWSETASAGVPDPVR